MNWKDELYSSYVSSDQAGNSGDSIGSGAKLFRGNSLFIKSLIRRHFPPSRQSRVLDLGCGHGLYLYFVKGAGYANVTGVDFSAQQVALAHQIGIPEVKQANIFEYLASTQDTFDVILVMDVLEHLEPQELFDSLRQVQRIMNPGAKLIIHVPNAEGLFGMRIRFGDYTHTQAFTPRSISQVLKTLGFTNIRCFEDKPVPKSPKGLLRYLIWQLGTIPARLLLLAETGERRFVLSQNMLVTATHNA